MKAMHILHWSICVGALALLGAGCASSGSQDAGTRQPTKFKAADGRTIEIGKATPVNGGRSFTNPHFDKCWVADGFEFNGYDALLIAPVAVTATVKDDEKERLQLATEQIPRKLSQFLMPKGIFTNIVTSEAELKPGMRVLKVENTIVEYSKGSRAARYFAGLYGAGQPMLRVQGTIKEGDKPLFAYEGRRSGTSAGARVLGVYMSGDDIQDEDVHSMMLDLTDFMAAIAGKYPPKN